MKKIIIFLFVITIISSYFNNDKVIIPNESIRFRIIASSNDLKDQEQKNNVKLAIEPILEDVLSSSNDINISRININKSIPLMEKQINSITNNYSINYGNNYFPKKVYQNVEYPEGNYESLVITLGDGLGDNWWCVLFPPLCLLEAQEENIKDINYTFYIKEIIDKYN